MSINAASSAARRLVHASREAPALAKGAARLSTSSRALHTSNIRPSAALTLSPGRPQSQQRRPERVVGKVTKRTLFIQTENTPNADALKFKPNTRVLPENFQSSFLEYLSPRSTLAPPHPSPLASQLLQIDGVTSVFYGSDYITVSKDSSAQWGHVKPEIFSLITEAVTAGTPLVNTVEGKAGEGQEGTEQDSLQYNENDSEIVSMIKELLETRIRPAIQEDGGDIDFRGLKDGWVLLKLRGACRTCDSSTVTLRNGIESMLMHYIEGMAQKLTD